ncbi:MAG: hypothetical protein KIG14_02915 [Candidatus Sacchiramonaceae bacterium]|nr:hypothetical protein [Candidatus Saccharimonadaceae bacterium]
MEVDTNPIKKQTVSDDPELAKVLSGVNAIASDDASDDQDDTNLQYEALGEVPELEMPEAEKIEVNQAVEEPAVTTGVADNFIASVGGDLENIKNSALQDLRPLVDKLNATTEEKFDIYLLLLRSSDDKTLIEPAYATARSIEDETKRANALLDIIKEIDYLNSKNQ